MRLLRASSLLAACGLLSLLVSGCSPSTPRKGSAHNDNAPAITAIVPAAGTTPGGTTVTILGIGFQRATGVRFGSTNAQSYKVQSNTEISAVSPAQNPGIADIHVSSPHGTSAKVQVDRFTYVIPPPLVATISPTSGTSLGGTAVAIGGNYFDGATKVDFGRVPAIRFTVVSNTQITAITPVQIGGRSVVITTPEGTSAKVKAVAFDFKLIPVITSVSPNTGTTEGGTTITITGTGFTKVGRVTFSRVRALSFRVISSTEIQAVAPPSGEGPRYVYVSTPGGTNSASGTDLFIYRAPQPLVTGIVPSSGATTGGTVITIIGSGFTRAQKVTIGGVAASFRVISDTEITAVTPPHTKGPRDVIVITPGGANPVTSVDQFTYG